MQTTEITIKTLPANHAMLWIKTGFAFFKAYPLMWIVLILLYLAIILPISMLPFIGTIIGTLMAPIFAAGLMWGCHAIENKQELMLNHLFEGFKKNMPQLVMIGVFFLLGMILIGLFLSLTIDPSLIKDMEAGKEMSEAQLQQVLVPSLIALSLLLPLQMAYWFAPALASLNQVPALRAMQLSFMACVHNMLPFLLFSVLATGVLILAFIPFGLGLLVAIPTLIASTYASYHDIFETK